MYYVNLIWTCTKTFLVAPLQGVAPWTLHWRCNSILFTYSGKNYSRLSNCFLTILHSSWLSMTNWAKVFSTQFELAGAKWFEHLFTESRSVVLPLDETPKHENPRVLLLGFNLKLFFYNLYYEILREVILSCGWRGLQNNINPLYQNLVLGFVLFL